MTAVATVGAEGIRDERDCRCECGNDEKHDSFIFLSIMSGHLLFGITAGGGLLFQNGAKVVNGTPVCSLECTALD